MSAAAVVLVVVVCMCIGGLGRKFIRRGRVLRQSSIIRVCVSVLHVRERVEYTAVPFRLI